MAEKGKKKGEFGVNSYFPVQDSNFLLTDVLWKTVPLCQIFITCVERTKYRARGFVESKLLPEETSIKHPVRKCLVIAVL